MTTDPMPIKALAPWFGGKRTLAPRIVAELGKHTSYWEGCAGSLAVLFAKAQSREETVIDLHCDVTNLARVIASDQWWELADRVERTMFSELLFSECRARLVSGGGDELQRAYDYLVVSWMGLNGVSGTANTNANFCVRYTSNGGDPAKRWRSVGDSLPAWNKRLQGVRIYRRDLFTVVDRIEDKEGTVFYIDPPYLEKSHKYLHDFANDQHRVLAEKLRRFKKTRVVVSYYAHADLSALYAGWTILPVKATKALVSSAKRDETGAVDAPEVLIINGPSHTTGAHS